MSDSAEKRCPDCGETKPLAAFSRNASRGDGLQFYCRACFSRRAAASYRARQRRKGKTVRERAAVPAGHKFCPGCQQAVPVENWHRTRRTRDGLASHCKDCRKVRGRRDHLKRTFGLSQEGLDALVASQGGLCAICRVGKPGHIDHDHETGKVRGVLCGPCNMGLGLFKDDPARLHAARRYLSRARGVASPMVVELYDAPPFPIEIDPRGFHAA